MDIFGTIKNLFRKTEQPMPITIQPEPTPIVVEKKRLPKTLMSEYRQDFTKYDDFNTKHRPHQKKALQHLKPETIGQITIPTGTGKTRIQVDVHISDMIEKTKNGQTGVYVIGAHRLALCSQLLYDIVEVAIPCGLQFDVLQVNSNSFTNDAIRTQLRKEGKIDDNLRSFNDLISKGANTTRQDDVLDFVNKAKANNRHVIIVATYHSINKLAILPEIDICTYDEAHITLGENFTDNISQVQPIIKKNFFFTATRKVVGTFSGMNDTEKFGEVLYSLSPRTMIEAGEIVPPRLHSIRISEDAEDGDYDNNKMLIKTISESFAQHKAMIKSCSANPDLIGAKLLVSCTGSKELKTIIASMPFRLWCDDNNIKVFSFSTNDEVGYRFNFKEVTRTELFSKMNDLTDSQDAIIFHIDILTEGIDLPSITGVMPLRNLNQSKLIQTIGRATRLLPYDRQQLYSGQILPNQPNTYVKPYCWFLVPQLFESLGDFNSMKRLLRDIMNSYDVRPEEFASMDRFVASFEAVLPKVTTEDEISRREKECDLSHIFEDIWLSDWTDMIGEMNSDEQFAYIKKELEAYNA
jgi:superfamily II DNA or RNA helicase